MGFIIVIEIQCRDKIASQLSTIPSLEIVDDDLAQRVITRELATSCLSLPLTEWGGQQDVYETFMIWNLDYACSSHR